MKNERETDYEKKYSSNMEVDHTLNGNYIYDK